MPDVTKQTLSATQTPALFGASPYLTRWMLLRHFIHGDPIDSPGDNRMDWGSKMQALVLAQAAEDLHLEVKPNAENVYLRSGLLGCTRDAEIMCPDRGPGALETKCVFDYGVWMRDWDGGKTPPRHYEIQLQQQMLVGDGEDAYDWGVLAVWVCGEVHYFERKPITDLWLAMGEEAEKFFADVAAKREGEPFGEPVEVPLLNRLFAPQPGVVVDLTTREDARELVSVAQLMRYHANERSTHDKEEKKYKAKLKAVMGDASEGILPEGVKIKAKQTERAGYTVKPTKYTTIDVFLPGGAPTAPPEKQPDNVLAGG